MHQPDPTEQMQQRLARLEASEAARKQRTRRLVWGGLLAAAVLLPLSTLALPDRVEFEAATVISAGDVNQNFENLWNQVEANATSVADLETGHDVVFSDSVAVDFAADDKEAGYVPVVGDDGQLSVTVTTSGRPVHVGLVAAGVDAVSSIRVYQHPGFAGDGYIRITRTPDGGSATNAFTHRLRAQGGLGGTDGTVDYLDVRFAPSSVSHIDPVAAGTYTFKLETSLAFGTAIQFQHLRMFAYEL